MKKTFLTIFAASAVLFTACGGENTETPETPEVTEVEVVKATYTVNSDETTLTWNGFEVANAEGHFHKGTVPVSGTIDTEDGTVTGGALEFDLLNMTYLNGISHDQAIATEDTSMTNKLFGHFMAEEMLNSANFPKATLALSGYDKEKDCVGGTLTIGGNEVMIEIPYGPIAGEETLEYTNSFDLDLSSVIPMLAAQEGMEEPGMKVSFSLNLKAAK